MYRCSVVDFVLRFSVLRQGSWARNFDPAASKGRRQRFVHKKHEHHGCAEFPGNPIRLSHWQSTMDGNNQLRPFLIHRAHGKLGLQGRSTEHMESWVCGAFAVSDDVD